MNNINNQRKQLTDKELEEIYNELEKTSGIDTYLNNVSNNSANAYTSLKKKFEDNVLKI